MTLAYHVELTPDDNGTILVSCPALPEVTTFGEGRDDAMQHAIGAIEEALAARIADSQDIPSGGKIEPLVRLPMQTAIKVELYRQTRKLGVTRAELTRRLGWRSRESVDRLFRLDHRSRLDHLEAAYRALNRELDLRVKKIA
jgi:antitoxin HicB